MRPYRGLTKEGKWVFGWYYHNPFVDIHSILWAIDHSTFDLKHVIPETVGQSTGLKAKKSYRGTRPEDLEIYEGDIIKWDDCSGGKYWRYAKVIFENGMYGFEVIKAEPEWSCEIGYKFIGNFAYQEETEKELEVIGNIHKEQE